MACGWLSWTSGNHFLFPIACFIEAAAVGDKYNLTFMTGTLLLWCWRRQSLWPWHCGFSLQSLFICWNQYQWHQWRSHARTGTITFWPKSKYIYIRLLCWIFFSWWLKVGISSWPNSWHLCRRWVMGCALRFGGNEALPLHLRTLSLLLILIF